MRFLSTLTVILSAASAMASSECTSAGTFVFLQPETSSFWNTATNTTVTLPIDCPPDATSATLEVRGVKHSETYSGLTAGTFDLHLPAPVSPETENVYDLTLTFDDGTVRKARLGLVQGLSTDAEGVTRCIAPYAGATWNRMRSRAVLPIPYGTTAFTVTVNGATVTEDTGLYGAQGWYALGGVRRNDSVTVSLTADGSSRVETLRGRGDGGVVINFK